MSVVKKSDEKLKRRNSWSSLSSSPAKPELSTELDSLEISGSSSPELFAGYSDILRQRDVRVLRPVSRKIFQDNELSENSPLPVPRDMSTKLPKRFPLPACSEKPQSPGACNELALSSEDSAMERGKFKYVNSPVKRHAVRKNLVGYACNCCREYFETLNLAEGDVSRRMKTVSRHRSFYAPPKSPDHFWEVSFPSTQELTARGWLNPATTKRKEH
uniref:DNA endonuclease activator Ctp1 C-terminal domain-containing protein n=1 Tax=Trichuris muris TaxID=70415 RepID=A0A5S6Q844_TRIMR